LSPGKKPIQEAGMRLTMQVKKSVIAAIALRYQKERKKRKGFILNEFIELTGYNRSYASHILQAHGKKIRVGNNRVIEGNIWNRAKKKRLKKYNDKVLKELKKIWGIMDCICGKRLAPMLKEIIFKAVSGKIKVEKGGNVDVWRVIK
jgi:hypothetical protein